MQRILALLLGAVVNVGLPGCATKDHSATAEGSNIIVATAGPMSGPLGAFGEQMRSGANQAVSDLNIAGGILGKQLVLQVKDDLCDPKQAVAVANDLVSKGVVFVAGHFCSSTSMTASKVYAEDGVLMMTPASSHPKLTDDAKAAGWTNVFRTFFRDDAQGLVAGQWLADRYQGKKVAIIHDKSTYGRLMAEATKKAMNGSGLQEETYETINQGDKDFSALISKLKATGIEAVYLGLYVEEGSQFVRQARAQDFGAQFLSEDAMVDDQFWAIAGDAGEGMLMTFAADPRQMATAKHIVAKFQKAGYDPEGYTLYTYAAFQVWAEAVKQAGTTDVAKVGDVLRQNTYRTAIGDLRFDDKGDVIDPTIVFYKWSQGTYYQVPALN
jgi:branched-chain amino acid transport system substrate-binding protein